MRLGFVVLLALLAGCSPAHAQRTTIFVGVDLPEELELGYASSARVVVTGARVVGARTPFEGRVQMSFSASGREVIYWRTEEPLGACRGVCCGVDRANYRLWLEVEPEVGGGICPGLQCKVEVYVEFYPNNEIFAGPRRPGPVRIEDFVVTDAATAKQIVSQAPCALPLARP